MSLKPEDYANLEQRIGRLYLNQRQGMEEEHVEKVRRRANGFFHVDEGWSLHSFLRGGLRMFGLHRRGKNNAANLQIRHNEICSPQIPKTFDGFTLLHLSDLHLDISSRLTAVLTERLQDIDYDLCVITGDFRAKSLGPHDQALAQMAQVCEQLKGEIYGVLGNHDFIGMVPELEAMGVRMLLNESATVERDGERIYLAGIDDPHYYRMDNLEKASLQVPHEAFSILLSHAPAVYRWAAHADYDYMLCGHTHGGQVCLPGGKPVAYGARCPRHLGQGAWEYKTLKGYTSVGSGAAVVDVRFNCPPEITLHHFKREL